MLERWKDKQWCAAEIILLDALFMLYCIENVKGRMQAS